MAPVDSRPGREGTDAPKAYLVVPLVGAFGIDFPNGLLITATINLWR